MHSDRYRSRHYQRQSHKEFGRSRARSVSWTTVTKNAEFNVLPIGWRDPFPSCRSRSHTLLIYHSHTFDSHSDLLSSSTFHILFWLTINTPSWSTNNTTHHFDSGQIALGLDTCRFEFTNADSFLRLSKSELLEEEKQLDEINFLVKQRIAFRKEQTQGDVMSDHSRWEDDTRPPTPRT